jgi:DNA-binding HxlR family transcriptional regulator
MTSSRRGTKPTPPGRLVREAYSPPSVTAAIPSLGHPSRDLDSAPSTLVTPELERLFVKFREEVALFRNQVLASAGTALALPPDAQAQANLGIVRSIFGKWSIDILTVLVTMRAARFSDLRRTLRGISSDVLSRKLFELETVGLVERRVGVGRPPTVEYRLTEDGFTMTRLGEPVLLFLRLRRAQATARRSA